jgi:hypothetical protein
MDYWLANDESSIGPEMTNHFLFVIKDKSQQILKAASVFIESLVTYF